MDDRSKGYLWDMVQSANALREYTTGLDLDSFVEDAMMRDAVERRFLIIGEALIRLRRHDPTSADQISHAERIIGLRNVIAHEYDRISPAALWRIVQEDIPVLREELVRLLASSAPSLPG